jgi:AbrB family looped-hinge helix DNA binding protein
MQIIKISSKFQVAIPKSVREALNLNGGDQLQVLIHDQRIELIPLREISTLKGIAKGIKINLRDENE